MWEISWSFVDADDIFWFIVAISLKATYSVWTSGLTLTYAEYPGIGSPALKAATMPV